MATRQARQASPQETTNRTFRIPLVGSLLNRETASTKDERFVNCFVEQSQNPFTESKKHYLVKRSGLASRRTYTAGAGRGCFRWNGADYVAIGNTLYKDAASHQALTGTSGHVGFTIVIDGYTEKLFFCDGTNGFVTDGTTVTQIPKTFSAWTADTVTALNTRVIPTSGNGYFYECIARTGDFKTHATTEPVWPTIVDDQIVDDAVTWICRGYYGFSYATWSTPRTPAVGAQIVPTTSNGYYYECTVSGAVGGTEPSWPQTVGNTVVDGAATWECVGLVDTTTPMPRNHLPYPIWLDQTLYLIATDGSGNATQSLYNSGVRNPHSWNQIDFTDAEMYPDVLRCLTRHHNTVLAVGRESLEFFTDEANPTGSPLSRNTTMASHVGSPAAETVQSADKYVMFVGTQNAGGWGVWLIEGYTPTIVSTDFIDRILNAEGSSISNARAFFVNTKGHLFYVLRLTSRTLVYDVKTKSWSEWSTNSGGSHAVFTGAYSFDLGDGTALILGSADGILYTLSPTTYQDNSVNILMDITTTLYDFESMHRKFMSKFTIVGDLISGGSLSVRWTDDDYVTWNTAKTLSLTYRAFFARAGAFRRRAFNIVYSGNDNYRIEGLECDISLGSH